MDDQCTLRENMAKVKEARKLKDRRVVAGKMTAKSYQEAWATFWETARNIEPCHCNTCEAERVLREINGETFEDIYEEIVQNGW